MLYLKREYEPAIDGLRALAVLSVLLFHASIPGFSGGFVGVDIFFVISGYLITRNILGDLRSGEFSFTGFYIRRIRRIFPAMFFTLVSVFIAGIFLFFPAHMERLGESTFYAAFGLSNFFFWHEAGYWDVSKNFKPLLHFWSLAVEEQFYLFWPALLFGLTRFIKVGCERAYFMTLAVLFVASLVLSQIFLNIDDTGSFYLMPFRIFEFCIGAFVLWLDPQKFSVLWRGSIVVLLGLVCACLPVYFYTEASPFPGVWAVLPCFGAALLITARHSRAGMVLLGNPVMVGIGKVSYSLYLVHWPILIFYQYVTPDKPSLVENLMLLLASVVASFFMYLFVEQPFRKKWNDPDALKPSRVFALVAALLIAVEVPAVYMKTYAGGALRVEHEQQTLHFSSEDVKMMRERRLALKEQREQSHFFDKHPSDFVIIGDSYSYDVLVALEKNGVKSPVRRIHLLHGGCVPLIGQPPPGVHPRVKTKEYVEKCADDFRRIITSDVVKKARVIMIAAHWYPYSLGGFGSTVAAIRKVSNAPIIIFGNKMIYAGDVPTRVSYWGKIEGLEDYINSGMKWKDGHQLNDNMKHEVEQIDDPSVFYVDMIKLFCPHDVCPILSKDQKLYIIDDAHWSVEGAAYFGKKFKASNSPAAQLLFGE